MRTLPCRACGAKIGFIEMPSGRRMPVDPDLVKACVRSSTRGTFGKGLLALTTERGQIVSGVECSVTDPEAEAVEGYVSHFATCTKPGDFRRP
jgi:hypothetical protein